MEKIQKYLPLATFILILFIFLKGCGTSTQVKSTEKKVEQLNHKVDFQIVYYIRSFIYKIIFFNL